MDCLLDTRSIVVLARLATMNYSSALESWVLRSMPLLVQSEQDINEGFGLVALFYHYNAQLHTFEFHYIFKVD